MKRSVVKALILSVLGGCTTIGAMPGMTMSSMRPEPRAGAELQFSGVPGFHLSDAARDDEHGKMMPQLGGFIDLGQLIGPADGLAVGFRAVENVYEPMLRYRRWLDKDHRVALGGVAFGTYATDSEDGASATYVRVGGELGADIRLTPVNRWAELHLQVAATLTALSADGKYCVDPATGLGQDCQETSSRVQSAIGGAFATGSIGLSLDLFRGVPILHDIRLGAVMAGGNQPQLRFGRSIEDTAWYSFGFNVEMGIGDW